MLVAWSPRLEVVIVHHRTPKLLLAALERLAQHAPLRRVTVVDTALDPSLPRQLEGVHPRLGWRAGAQPLLRPRRQPRPQGTTAPLVAVMNADVLVGPATLDDLIWALRRPASRWPGHWRGRPTATSRTRASPTGWHVARLRWRRPARSVAPPPRHRGSRCPWLSGCLLVVRRDALARVGGMDGSLRFYNEDLEWGAALPRRRLPLRPGRDRGGPRRRRLHASARSLPRRGPAGRLRPDASHADRPLRARPPLGGRRRRLGRGARFARRRRARRPGARCCGASSTTTSTPPVRSDPRRARYVGAAGRSRGTVNPKALPPAHRRPQAAPPQRSAIDRTT
jgi:hypothetical protein